jgi:hypothetical protein
MPSSVTAMLAVADLTHLETARWGVRPTFDGAGVYLVALAEQPNIRAGLASAPLARQRVRQPLDVRPELTVDGERPDVEQLLARLAKLWLSEETILYIGRASASVSNRVMAYYNTPLGASAPPAGGWPIKTLGGLSNICVHVAATADPARAEEAMIDAFVSGVSALDRRSVVDPDLPLPFANLEDGRHRRKRHGIRGARKPYARKLSLATLPPAPRDDAAATPGGSAVETTLRDLADEVMLNVTAKDLARGCIRVTSSAKRLLSLPPRASEIRIHLRGQPMTCAWDARLGLDRERSGLPRVGRERLTEVVHDMQTPLALRVTADGEIHLD